MSHQSAEFSNVLDLTKFPPALPKRDAILFAIGEFFLPGLATIVYGIVNPGWDRRFDRSFVTIGLLQILLIIVLGVGVLWAWCMGAVTLYKSLKASPGVTKTEHAAQHRAKRPAKADVESGTRATQRETSESVPSVPSVPSAASPPPPPQ